MDVAGGHSFWEKAPPNHERCCCCCCCCCCYCCFWNDIPCYICCTWSGLRQGVPGFSSTSSAKQLPLSSFTVRVHASINTLLQMSSLIVNSVFCDQAFFPIQLYEDWIEIWKYFVERKILRPEEPPVRWSKKRTQPSWAASTWTADILVLVTRICHLKERGLPQKP